jgi:hypothetical protein
METAQGAPAPAPPAAGHVMDVTVHDGPAAAPPNGAQPQYRPPQDPALAEIMKTLAELKDAKKGSVRVASQGELSEVVPAMMVEHATDKQKELLAKLLDLAGEHKAARQLRGKKENFLEKTFSVGTSSVTWQQVTGVIAGGLVIWVVYEAFASKMDWSFRVGIWDPRGRR